ncbi:MAG: hypothetical protein VB060_08940 [Oscillibacter sp.]|uniref:hypothetical protein n=1 Tax=uncultured Oscillibacter sp. TaxID=876091 RepID=UPI0025DC9BC9|nr:hypothetical protein [Oscillibacter sp.]MEA4993938.1 hypothetical protein [Oscillibacter sp.]
MAGKFCNQVMRLSLQERTKKKNSQLHDEKVRLESLSDEALMFYYLELKSSYEYKKNVFSFLLVTILVAGISDVWRLLAEIAQKALALDLSRWVCTEADLSAILTVFCLVGICISAAVFAMLIWYLKSMRITHQMLLMVEKTQEKREILP